VVGSTICSRLNLGIKRKIVKRSRSSHSDKVKRQCGDQKENCLKSAQILSLETEGNGTSVCSVCAGQGGEGDINMGGTLGTFNLKREKEGLGKKNKWLKSSGGIFFNRPTRSGK